MSYNFKKINQTQLQKYSFKDDSFNKNNIPKEVFDWKNSKNRKTLFLTGPSNTGKTCLAYNLVKDEGGVLFVGEINKLRDFDSTKHKAILFDDFPLIFKKKEEFLHLIDNEFPRDIRVLFDMITLPVGLSKIFTTNDKNLPFEDLLEIKRRIIKVNIHQPVYYKNLNIINNSTTLNVVKP